VSDVWLVVIVVGVGTIALKAAGPLLIGGRSLPPRVASVFELLGPAVLAALVVTQVVGGDHRWVFDARLVGLAAAVATIWLRAPVIVTVLVAAAATALWRSFL
jgi:branched-subunit amino acid transport protein